MPGMPGERPMIDLVLTRDRDDRRRYVLDGFGSLRLEGLSRRRAGVETPVGRFAFRRPSVWGRRIEASDEAGVVVGEYAPRTMRRGGMVRWGERRFELRASSFWRTQYTLADGDRELLVVEGRGWGRRPVRMRLDPDAGLDATLVLFAAFVVHGIAQDDGAAVAAVT